MLGEAFLQVLNQKEDTKHHEGLTTQSSSNSRMLHDCSTANTKARSPQTPQTLRAGRSGSLENPGLSRGSVSSIAMPIRSYSNDVDLYTSWCCPSFYKNYPDLRLAGDRVEHWSSPNPDLDPSDEGPLLQSQDISSLEPSLEPNRQPHTGTKQDEEYLVMKSTQSPVCENRLTNSMLNGYLEVQMLEVFCQHMENMACCGSSLLVPEVMPALVPTSMSTSEEVSSNQEEELDSSSSDGVRYLSTCSAPATSHFSSPVLRISEVE